jgi:neutral ceramidase
MKIGAAEADITPPVGGDIVGPMTRSTGVHDPLFVKVLYVDDGRMPWVLVSFDLMALDYGICDRMRKEIREQTGATAAVLNCTHTHSAPFSAPWSVPVFERHCREEREWREELASTVPALAVDAQGSVASATLHAGRAPVAIGFNRRLRVNDGIAMLPNYHAPIVPWVDVLEARGKNGRPIAVVFSHAAHPVIVHAATTELGADYPGYAAAHLHEELGADGVFMFCQGCGADINGYPLAAGDANADLAGRKLAAAVLQAMDRSQELTANRFAVMEDSIRLPCEDMPAVESLDRMIEEMEQTVAEAGEEARGRNSWAAQDRLDGYRALRDDAAAGVERTVRMDLSAAVSGGQWALVALANEPFCEYALEIDRDSPFDSTMVLGYSHGDESYIPTDEALELRDKGGYEAASFPNEVAASFCYPLRLSLKPGAERLIHHAVRRMWS